MTTRKKSTLLIASLLLLCEAAWLAPPPAEARKPPRKLDWRSRNRRFPSEWCPLISADIPEFKAEGSTATLRFVVDRRPNQRIDNVYVVEKSVFLANLRTDPCDDGSVEQQGELFFDPGSAPVTFLERFDSEANGWRPSGASWGQGEDDGEGALFFDPNGLAAIVVSGLRKGKTYVIGASWYTHPEDTEGAVLNVRVDPSGQLGCGPDKALSDDLGFAADPLSAGEEDEPVTPRR